MKILFIELLGGIGDLLIALPSIHALKKSHPHAALTVLTFATGGELIETDPLLDRVIYVNPQQVAQSVKQLLSFETFDLIISDTNYDGIGEMITQSSATKVVTNLWRSPPPDELISDRFLKILLAEALITSDSITDKQPYLYLTQREKITARKELKSSFRPLIFLIPDAGMDIKQWPVSNFITLGKQLQEKFNANIIVPSGLKSERAAKITQGIGEKAKLWPQGGLRYLAAILSEADLVIAADTGPARIAAALDISTITLFGPSWHGRYGQSAPHINLQGFSECSERNISNFTEQSCWYSGRCPFEWQNCLVDISPDDVFQKAIELLHHFLKDIKDLIDSGKG